MRWILFALCITLLFPARALAQNSDADGQTTTPIKHVIYLMQENHSFDNYFGTYPGAEGLPEGVCMPVNPDDPANQTCIEPFHIGNQTVVDLYHSNDVHWEQYNEGQMNGFISAHDKRNRRGELAMGYYDQRDIPFYWNVARDFVLFDHFFTSAVGGSVWNHNFWVGAAPGNSINSIPEQGYGEDFVTIFDRLEERGISWKFYIQNYDPRLTYRTMGEGGMKATQISWVPLLNIPRFLDNPTLFGKIAHLDEYFEDVRAGTLPAVAYIVPSGAREHPPGSIRAGERFVRTLIQELMKSDAWYESAFIWTYDDWGGWYDHVVPPQVDDYGYGFRAPALLVSPYAKRGYIDKTVYDFTSPIKFINENWGLEPLAARDANTNSIANAFDFTQEPRPPYFLSADNADDTPPSVARREYIFGTYSTALLLASLLIGWAVVADVGWRRNT